MGMSVPIPYLQPPVTIVNQSIDVLGAPDLVLGDITDGTLVAEAARRNYGQALRQLLRANHWPFARFQADLVLLGDASGNSPAPVSSFVESPWGYAYAWPTDAVQGRWLPWNPTGGLPTNAQGVPLTTGGSSTAAYSLTPGRFLVSSSDQYPVQIGVQPWNQLPDLQRTEGLGPTYRKVILTDCMNARFVYTRLVTTIEEWDDGFRQAMVMMMAMVLAPVAITDPKLRLAEIARLTPLLKNTIDNARLAAGNEAGWPQSTDFEASFIRGRNAGTWWGATSGIGGTAFGPLGGYGLGYDQLSWGSSVF